MTYKKYQITITGQVEVTGMTFKEVKDESCLSCMGTAVENQKKTVKLIKKISETS